MPATDPAPAAAPAPAADAPAADSAETSKAKANGATKKGTGASKKKAAESKPAAAPTRARSAREVKKPAEPGASLAIPTAPKAKRTASDRKPSNKPTKSPVVAPIKIPKSRKLLASGTIVWAKMTGFPWYPGTVVEENDKSVPPKVKDSKPDNAAKDKCHLIKFVGDRDRVTWGWIPAALMQHFNETATSDQQVMQNQRYKTSKERNDVKKQHSKYIKELEASGTKPKATEEAGDEKMDVDAEGEAAAEPEAATAEA